MWLETLGFFATWAMLALIGFGPAVLALRQAPQRLSYAGAVAPAVGLAIISLLGLPLVRYVGPVREWAWPVTGLLVVVSLVLVARDWQQRRVEYAALMTWRSLPPLAVVLGGLIVLAAPLALRGIQYVIYRSNPHDAFLYMSMAETVRTVEWRTLLQGAALTYDNWENVVTLAQASPTALFTARQVELPLALSKMVGLAWSAEMAGTTVPRFIYAHHLLAFATGLPLTLALGARLGLARWINWLAGLGVTLGFWARFVLETDAGYEISTLPMVMLIVFAWTQVEMETARAFSASRWLLAVACAAVIGLYVPPALSLAAGGLLYYAVGVAQRTVTGRAVLLHGVTLGLVLGLLTVTGQADFIYRQTANLIARAPNERRFAAPAADLMKANGAAALWGMPGSVLWGQRAAIIRWPLDQAAGGLGLFLTGLLVLGAVNAARSTSPPAERIMQAVAVGGLLVAVALAISDNDRAAGKSITYIFPFLTLGLLQAAQGLRTLFAAGVQRAALAVTAAWLATQAGLGTVMPFRGRAEFLSQAAKAEQYDVAVVTRVLDEAQPQRLMVDIPRGNKWMFAVYSMFVFGQYPAHFQSGLVIDNNPDYQALWTENLTELPDYAVVLKSVDYIGPEHLGEKLAETQDLVLYRITSTDLARFQAEERLYQEQESLKPLFPSLSESIDARD
jgi:hypothetical protein